MKTEINDSYQTYEGTFDYRTDFMISMVLPINKVSYAILKTKLSPKDEIIEIRGGVNKTIQISDIIPKTVGINHTQIFTFKKGFGYMDWINSKLILWKELEGEPIIVNVRKSDSLDLKMRPKCMAFVSYDSSDNTLLIGINDNGGPAQIARYYTILQLPELNQGRVTEINIEWNSVEDLNPDFYPKTYYNHQYPALEWLNIMDMIKVGDFKYCHTTGGKRTRMKSGPQYEFNILSKMDDKNRVIKNLEIEKGACFFSADKQFLLVHPKKSKHFMVYDLEQMSLAYKIPRKPPIDIGQIDLFDDRIYVYNMGNLNICDMFP